MELNEKYADMWHYVEIQMSAAPLRDDLLKFKDEVAKMEARHHQHTYCAYCGKECFADSNGAVDEIEKHIWSCEKHPLQRLRGLIEEKCKDLDFEAQELLTTEKESDLKHASGIHKSIDLIREALDEARRFANALES